jgi:hypothetical protein
MKLKRNKYWFVPKLYGWGFVPISWEGWLATLGLIILVYISSKSNGLETQSPDSMRFLFDLAILIIVFSLFAKTKTKGRLRWRWGK